MIKMKDSSPYHYSYISSTLSPMILIITVITAFIIISLRKRRWASTTRTSFRKIRPSRTLAVLGSGGHTTEMIRLLSSLNKHHFKPLYYVVASTDTTSISRLNNYIKCQNNNSEVSTTCSTKSKEQCYYLIRPTDNEIFTIPRAREVGQSYFTSIFTTLQSIISSAHIIFKTKPDLLIINGPGTCLPIAFWTFIGRIIGLCQGKIIFCESFCRVNTLSLTGKILVKLNMVDLFLVHWQELMDSIDETYDTGTTSTKKTKFILIDSFLKHI